MLLILTYYLVSLIINYFYKYNYINFDALNNSLENSFKQSYDVFIPIKRELDLYERNLINCTTLGVFYKMNLTKINDIKTPKFEYLIMDIVDDNDFKKETIDKFNIIFNEDICLDKIKTEKGLYFCKNIWSGILSKGIRQAIIQMGAIIGNVLDELESINDINSNKTLFSLMNDSSFFYYQVFNEMYLFRTYIKVKNIFNDLRKEKLESIFRAMKFTIVVYFIIIIIVSAFFINSLFYYRNVFNSFLNFIVIIPAKYFEEDDKACKAITSYGNYLFE